jgi:hypothetical protein
MIAIRPELMEIGPSTVADVAPTFPNPRAGNQCVLFLGLRGTAGPLSYRLNLGMVLRMAGRLDGAETELRHGAEDRLAFYGREHPGYAFGLEPLAEVLLQRGNASEARRWPRRCSTGRARATRRPTRPS